MKRINLYVSSNMGLKRTNNEDMVLVGSGLYRDEDWRAEGVRLTDTDHYAAAVCDGMGGQNAGEVASEDVAIQLRKFVSELPNGLDDDKLIECISLWHSDENEYLQERGNMNEALENMGTTLVGWLYYEGRSFWLNCGDSRIYRLQANRLTQLSTDHSLYNVTHNKAHSHIVTNCMGAGCMQSYIDVVEMEDDFKSTDLLMICSDGLSDMLTDKEIEHILVMGGRANELTQAACEAGGRDNVSVCIVEFL